MAVKLHNELLRQLRSPGYGCTGSAIACLRPCGDSGEGLQLLKITAYIAGRATENSHASALYTHVPDWASTSRLVSRALPLSARVHATNIS